ncbi:MAG: hypothetical protein ABI747_01525 [Candidatus Moraniibacteriota bacterium]
MNKIKTRFWLSLITVLAFFAPLVAVFAVEQIKNSTQLAQEQENYLASLSASDEARAQYYQNVEAKKSALQKTMADAKAQYDALMKDQPAQVAAHTQSQTQTTTQPVTLQKIVQPSSSSSSTSQPKSTRKTKTS